MDNPERQPERETSADDLRHEMTESSAELLLATVRQLRRDVEGLRNDLQKAYLTSAKAHETFVPRDVARRRYVHLVAWLTVAAVLFGILYHREQRVASRQQADTTTQFAQAVSIRLSLCADEEHQRVALLALVDQVPALAGTNPKTDAFVNFARSELAANSACQSLVAKAAATTSTTVQRAGP